MADIDGYKATFELIDSNGDGRIDADELHKLMKSLGQEITPELAAQAVQKTDTDGDGEISLEEFAEWLRTSGGSA